MKVAEIRNLMETFDLFDGALLFHSYTRYMRDYELFVQNHVGPTERGTYSYLFKYCVEANVSSPLSGEIYRKSLEEQLTDYETGKDLDGYVWGVKWSLLYPGWELITESKKASAWQQKIGIEFHEISIQSDAYNIELIFSDLSITKLSDRVDEGITRLFIPIPPPQQ